MTAKFSTVDLSDLFNSPAKLRLKATKGRPAWGAAAGDLAQHMPRGDRTFWGIPFRLGPEDLARKGILELTPATPEVTVPLVRRATHLCVLHCCNSTPDRGQSSAGGETLAVYVLRYADGTEHAVPIRRRFEISQFSVGWGSHTFAAMASTMPGIIQDPRAVDWGFAQTGVRGPHAAFQTWVYALENPRPEAELASVILRGASDQPVAVLGLTLYDGPGHPLRHVPRKLYRLLLPAGERALPGEVSAELDMGVVTRVYAAPGEVSEEWLTAPDRGLGIPYAEPTATREFLVEATGAEGATLTVNVAGKATHDLSFGQAFTRGKATSADGKARLEIINPRTAWVHVTVTDESTGRPTATRAHFRGKHGEYIAPYGHHWEINDGWFEDYGGDLQLGRQSFAYVPGSFQVELPVGEVYVELNKGFEYTPVRRKLEIKPGQRELKLGVKRSLDLRKGGWVTADTHVHFITPQTAALEGKAEGLNLINLLASQWGRLFTNVADITGEASGCSDDETLVWVGTENRNHLLGHISMLGTHGDPVFPMCAGGVDEAYVGDPDVITLTEWARMCKEREGVVIRPHFPSPICEEPVYFMLGELDGAELRQFASPTAATLDEFCFQEWYRYLNCGCRVAAVGGTDKMSAGMPVGGVRTYAQLDPNEAFSFQSWGEAVRAGRTFTTSGPLLELTVEGQPLGSDIRLPAAGGRLEVKARATSVWPIHALEIVVNGKVVADAREAGGAKTLSLRERLRVEESCWIAARCGSTLRASHCWPIHLGAHTSPVYVTCGDRQVFSPSDATYMLTLLDGGMTYLDTLSVRFSDQRHAQMKAIYAQAKHELLHRMERHHQH